MSSELVVIQQSAVTMALSCGSGGCTSADRCNAASTASPGLRSTAGESCMRPDDLQSPRWISPKVSPVWRSRKVRREARLAPGTRSSAEQQSTGRRVCMAHHPCPRWKPSWSSARSIPMLSSPPGARRSSRPGARATFARTCRSSSASPTSAPSVGASRGN